MELPEWIYQLIDDEVGNIENTYPDDPIWHVDTDDKGDPVKAKINRDKAAPTPALEEEYEKFCDAVEEVLDYFLLLSLDPDLDSSAFLNKGACFRAWRTLSGSESLDDGEWDHLVDPSDIMRLDQLINDRLTNFVDYTGGGSLSDALRDAAYETAVEFVPISGASAKFDPFKALIDDPRFLDEEEGEEEGEPTNGASDTDEFGWDIRGKRYFKDYLFKNPGSIKDFIKVKRDFPGADFWVQRTGKRAGFPSRSFSPTAFGVKVLRTDILDPGYLYYWYLNLFNQGFFRSSGHGAVFPHLQKKDIEDALNTLLTPRANPEDSFNTIYPSLHKRASGLFLRGGKEGVGSGSKLGALGEGLYLTWERPAAQFYVDEYGGELMSYKLPPDLNLLDYPSPPISKIKKDMGFAPWEYSDDPLFARMLRLHIEDLGYDGVASLAAHEGLVLFDPSVAIRVNPHRRRGN